MIRLATTRDAAGMLSIYAPYVLNTSITFETELPSEADFAARISHYLLDYPWLVAEQDGTMQGYAYASRYRERSGYQWSVECSVYIAEHSMRQGIASQLYKALFPILALQGFTTVYAVINLPNERSVSLHENLGFTYLTTYEKVGFKLGKWKDVGWWQLRLNQFQDHPATPTKFEDIDKSKLISL